MNPFEPLAHEIEICASGNTILLKSKIPIPRCWIKVSDSAGKIVFKKIEEDLTETTISLNDEGGIYQVTLITEKNFATKTVFMECA
ncbi:MAG: hypothetical protein WCP32_16730 [Bacteroidota bacterium]